MDIYEPNSSVLDLDAARDEAKATPLIRDKDTQRLRQAELTIAALLDIAASLRIVAAEAYDALADVSGPTPNEEAPSEDFLVVGDLVRVTGTERVGTIVKLGFDDGELIARVGFDGDSPTMTYYVKMLERLVGDERPDWVNEDEPTIDGLRESDVPLVGVATADETPALVTDADEDGEDAVGGYELEGQPDIEDDFAGPESAVDVLRANEAKKKAAKKSTKGKKS